MRIARYLTISIGFILIFQSCNEKENGTKKSLVGKWVATNFDKTGCTNEASNRTDDISCSDLRCYTLALNADKTYRLVVKENQTYSEEGEWFVKSNVITFSYENEDLIVTNTYEYEQTTSGLVLSNLVESTGCIETTTYIIDSTE